MATYAVSFDLKYDDTYSDRYDSFMKKIRESRKIWYETTSFVLVETTFSLSDFEQGLYLTLFSASKDKMLVMDVSWNNAIARGPIEDKKTLSELLPGIQIK
ncbi:MAG: hypothetical protein WBF99_12215 [Xanthobacteraceae bacterium]